MISRSLTLGLCAVTFLIASPANAADVSKCQSVVEGRAKIISFDAEMAYGKKVRLRGLLAVPDGSGPFRPMVILPGGRGPRLPHCFNYMVEPFLNWGFATLMVVPSPAREEDGTELFDYSFADLGNYAHGAATALAALPQIDPTRMVLWGHSRGGGAVIDAVSSAREKRDTFAGAIALAPYPACPGKAVPPAIPLLVMVGTEDTESPADRCVEYAAKLESVAGFEFLLLQDGGHSFWPTVWGEYNETAANLANLHLKAFLVKHSLLAP